MKYGVFDHMDYDGAQTQADFFENRLKLAELYDKQGYHAYHLAEHHATPLGMSPSPNVFLSALAQRTTTLRFGPLVYCLPLYHPLRLFEEMKAWFDEKEGCVSAPPESLRALDALREYPARRRCVLLAWEALESVLQVE